MVYQVLGALLRGGVLIGGPFNGYTFVFYFFFALKRSLNMHGSLESLQAYFKKTPINPIHPGLNIAVSFTDKNINLEFIFVEIWST